MYSRRICGKTVGYGRRGRKHVRMKEGSEVDKKLRVESRKWVGPSGSEIPDPDHSDMRIAAF